MIRSRDGLKLIADAISRKNHAAAVVVPRKIALSLVDTMCPQPLRPGLDLIDDALDIAVEKAREKYLKLVAQGGYIGMVMRVPMIVADDVVVCALSNQELTECASRFGVDLDELYRDARRGAA